MKKWSQYLILVPKRMLNEYKEKAKNRLFCNVFEDTDEILEEFVDATSPRHAIRILSSPTRLKIPASVLFDKLKKKQIQVIKVKEILPKTKHVRNVHIRKNEWRQVIYTENGGVAIHTENKYGEPAIVKYIINLDRVYQCEIKLPYKDRINEADECDLTRKEKRICEKLAYKYLVELPALKKKIEKEKQRRKRR